MVPGYKVDNKEYYLYPFFVLFVLFGAFFIMNLFVGVVISAFNKEVDNLGKNFLLTSA